MLSVLARYIVSSPDARSFPRERASVLGLRTGLSEKRGSCSWPRDNQWDGTTQGGISPLCQATILEGREGGWEGWEGTNLVRTVELASFPGVSLVPRFQLPGYDFEPHPSLTTDVQNFTRIAQDHCEPATMTDEVRVDTKQCHPPHVRFNTRTTYYNAFFLFRTAIAINGQPAQLGCSVGTAELTLNCRYPSTSVTMNSVFTEFTPILKKYGAYDVSNFWCDSGVPLFGVSFSSQHGLKKFLRSSETVNKGLACALFKMFNEQHSADRQKQGLKRASSEVFHKIEPDVNQQTLPEAEERKSPRPVAVNTVQAAQLESPATSPFHVLPVVLNSEVFQISPDPVKSQARLVEVTLDNYATCMNTWKESEVFDFASLFREHQTDQNAQGRNK